MFDYIIDKRLNAVQEIENGLALSHTLYHHRSPVPP